MQICVVEIARRQRQLHLLEKVKAGRHLTKAEIKELNEYDLTMTKPKTIKADAKPAKKKAVKKTARGKAAKKPAGKKKRPKRRRLAVSPARVKLLAMQADSFAAADSRLSLDRPLAEILKKEKRLAAAWQRGRFLGNLQQLAATAITIPEAAEKLELDAGELKAMLTTDIEAADIWNQARLDVVIEIKTAIVKQAKAGKPQAAKHVEQLLKKELAHKAADFTKVTIAQMVELTGKTRQTIHDWTTKHNCPRNSDRTYNLAEFLTWYEAFVGGRGRPARTQALSMDPLKAAKAEKIEIELDRQRGRLLDRGSVMAGLIARTQNLINSVNRKGQELAMLCHGQPTSKIAAILTGFFEDLRRQQCQVPEQLRLPPAAAEKFTKLLESLKPEGGE